MTSRTLEASVRRQPTTAVVELHGEIDSFAEAALNSAYADAESQSPRVIVLNFTDVDYINSTGIALIVGLLARARASHISLRAVGLSAHYVEIFQITRLADFVAMFPDEASALQPGASPT
ncbi:MAG TPA: STAS domain-containing protein [Ktedonobacterales bacterium]|nr:STAS domain-containing protein [Ktedonobacterales bacterium]